MQSGKPPFILLAGLAVLVAVAGPAGCGAKAPAKQSEAARARAVRVVRVEPRQVTGSLTASGALLPREEAAVSPEVTGFRVAQVLVDVGAHVRRGQVLARMDDTLIRAQLQQQAALAAQAAVQADEAEAQAARVRGLDGQGVLSQEQIEARRYQARAARATAQAQAASLADTRARAGKLAVTAPVDGLVLERTVRPGDMSAAGGTPWFRLARGGEVELLAELAETDLARVRPGQGAVVTLAGGAQAAGRVRLVSPQIDAQTKLGTVRVSLPVRPDIRAGGYARAMFGDAVATAPAVPETAIRYDGDGPSVMVVGADNRVKRVFIQTGARGAGVVTLLKGPAAGVRIVQSAAAFLLDGDLVRPIEDAAAAPGGRP